MTKLTDEDVESVAGWLKRLAASMPTEAMRDSCEDAYEMLRTLRRERAQLAARVEELEDQNRALKAALDGTLIADDGPEAA